MERLNLGNFFYDFFHEDASPPHKKKTKKRTETTHFCWMTYSKSGVTDKKTTISQGNGFFAYWNPCGLAWGPGQIMDSICFINMSYMSYQPTKTLRQTSLHIPAPNSLLICHWVRHSIIRQRHERLSCGRLGERRPATGFGAGRLLSSGQKLITWQALSCCLATKGSPFKMHQNAAKEKTYLNIIIANSILRLPSNNKWCYASAFRLA